MSEPIKDIFENYWVNLMGKRPEQLVEMMVNYIRHHRTHVNQEQYLFFYEKLASDTELMSAAIVFSEMFYLGEIRFHEERYKTLMLLMWKRMGFEDHRFTYTQHDDFKSVVMDFMIQDWLINKFDIDATNL